ncbi:MAG: hypothetical protein IPM45_18385, partial [Acidimicrobiales bacterium]|nr:hypothetical protein [Acidimicrobiales bacterium]
MQQIDVAGLNVDLGVLANQLGGSDEAAQLAAARIFQLATAAGQAGPQAAQLTDQILALSANAVALNPGLGDLGQVAEGLTTALARGGRFAAGYGLSLNAAEIEARALADTGKATAAELTLVERSTAGAALALERLGPEGVAGNVAAGIDNVRAQFGAVREEIGNLLEAAGGPILDPLLGVIRTGVPLVGSLAEVFGELLAGALPLA